MKIIFIFALMLIGFQSVTCYSKSRLIKIDTSNYLCKLRVDKEFLRKIIISSEAQIQASKVDFPFTNIFLLDKKIDINNNNWPKKININNFQCEEGRKANFNSLVNSKFAKYYIIFSFEPSEFTIGNLNLFQKGKLISKNKSLDALFRAIEPPGPDLYGEFLVINNDTSSIYYSEVLGNSLVSKIATKDDDFMNNYFR